LVNKVLNSIVIKTVECVMLGAMDFYDGFDGVDVKVEEPRLPPP
jgi:hypothetical protein